MRRWVTCGWIVLVLLSCYGCLQTPLIDCGNETWCPEDAVCATTTRDRQREVTICSSMERLTQCKDLTVAASCGDNGSCIMTSANLVCVENRCGDNIVSGSEQCDDGNLKSGDGCSRDCGSLEICGNGIIDGIRMEQCDDGIAGLSGDGCSSSCTVEAEVWVNVDPEPNRQRTDHAMAYDSARGEVVVFGGLVDGIANAETYEFNGTRWRKWRGVRGPPILVSPRMTYDVKRKRVVLIGHVGANDVLNETWEFDGVSWITLNATLPRRDGESMTYDSVRQRCLMFGGFDQQDIASNELWQYTGQQWHKVDSSIAPVPSPRGYAAIAFDPIRDKLSLFGGRTDAGDTLDDTWEYDGTSWQLLTLPVAPSARQQHSMYFDSIANKTVLFAGRGAAGNLDDSWQFDGGFWSEITVINKPKERSSHAMVFDDASGGGLLFGGLGPGMGELGEQIWEFRIASTSVWKSTLFTNTTNEFLSKTSHSYSFDPVRGSLVVFGGRVVNGGGALERNDTWEYNDDGWSQLPATNPPQKQFGQVMAYDSRRRVTVMFGRNGETWELSNAVWIKRAVSGPPARIRAAMIYDVARGKILLVGGISTVAPFPLFADTWEFDGTTWTQRDSIIIANGQGLVEHSLVYDWRNQKTVLIGGFTDDTNANANPQVFDFDGAAWQKRAMSNTLPSSPSTSATYDVLNQRIIALSQQRTFVLAAHEWQQLSSLSAPPPGQMFASLHYDSTHRRVLAFFQSAALNPSKSAVYSFGFSSSPATAAACNSIDDFDGDALIGCGDGLDPQDPVHNADPDCFGWCFPTCSPPGISAPGGQACDTMGLLSAPYCGDGLCNELLEDYLICPRDCERQ
jgi:cysteine-rich repeat protein